MPENGAPKSLAVLIDADNTSARYAQAIFEEIVTLGEANVRRIYGDFSKSQLAGWDGAIKSLAILQNQQRSNTKGKNASDIALVIDAMDLMHKGTLDGFCLISSDSDFTGSPNGCARTDSPSTDSASARRRRRSATPATASSMSRT